MHRFKTTVATIMLAALGFASPAHAQSAGFAGNKMIVGIDIGDSEALNIRLADNTFCGTPYVSVARGHSYYNDMLALALTAQANNKPINVYIASCAQSQPQIVRMVIGTVF